MKKVIIEKNEQVIRLEDVTDDMIIGVIWGGGKKSFLIKNENKRTIAINLEDRKTLNLFEAKTQNDYIQKTKKNSNAKSFFVFDSPKELAQWLAE